MPQFPAVNDKHRVEPPVVLVSSSRRFAELLGLCAFAIAQPLYVRLSTQTPFLMDTGTTTARLLLLTGAVYVGPPVLLWLAECGLGGRPAGRVRARHAGCVALLTALLGLQVVPRALTSRWLEQAGIAGAVTILLAALLAAGMVYGLRSRRWRQVLALAACGSVLFPIQFLRTGAAASILTPPGPLLQVTAARPAPVVMLIFDEFCGMSLLNEHRDIDAVRYPNFARLAATATWYRNATTVHSRTNYAVPALLTGRLPPGDREMTLAEAPQNLFTLLQSAGYTTAAFEPVSRLHPPVPHALKSEVSLTSWSATMAQALAIVYAHAVTPTDVPIELPEIPDVWHGLSDLNVWTGVRNRSSGVFRDASNVQAQFEHFLDCLPRDAEPALCLLHTMTPHCPWKYLPTGEVYSWIDDRASFPVANVGGLMEDWVQDDLPVQQAWQRHLLQVGDVDRRLGIVLDRLEEAGILDDTLLVVAADHGVSFRPGHSRRVPDGENLPDLLSVPLFIKLPGQSAGTVSDRNVESIDVLPTIAAALDMTLPLPVDGDSLLDESVPPRARKSLTFDTGSTVATADFPERFAALERMLDTFGSGSQDDRLWLPLGPFAELIGRSVAEIDRLPPGTVSVEILSADKDRPPGRATCVLLLGAAVSPESSTEPLPLALAAHGTIIGTAQTTVDPRLTGRWSCLVTGLAGAILARNVQVFAIRPTEEGPALEPCEVRVVSHSES